jgi:hypothetical protein
MAIANFLSILEFAMHGGLGRSEPCTLGLPLPGSGPAPVAA